MSTPATNGIIPFLLSFIAARTGGERSCQLLPAKAGSLSLALRDSYLASETYGALTGALLEQAPTANAHPEGPDLEPFTLTRFPASNRQGSVGNVHRSCNPLANQLPAFVQDQRT